MKVISSKRRGKVVTLVVTPIVLAATASSGLASATPSLAASNTVVHQTGAVDLTYWAWAEDVTSQVNLFNKTHPNIHVTLQQIPAGSAGGYAKMFAALKAGNAPCLAQVEYQEIPSFLVVNGLVNIKRYAEKDKGLFVPWQWHQGVFGGGLYAIPWASGPMGLYYNKPLFAKDGISSPPATWAQFAKDAAIIHHANPKQYIAAFDPTENGAENFAGYAWQAGARWFTTSGQSWHVNISSAATLKVASYWQKLVREGLVKEEGELTSPYYKDLQDGDILSVPGPDWMDVVLEDDAGTTTGQWRAADLPQWSSSGPFASANVGGSSVAVLKGCKDPAQAAQFAVWFNSNPGSVDLSVTNGNGWPALADIGKIAALHSAPKVFKFYGGQDIYKVFAKSDNSVKENWEWSPTIDATFEDLSSGFASAVANHGSFGSVVTKVQAQTTASLKAAGLPVTG